MGTETVIKKSETTSELDGVPARPKGAASCDAITSLSDAAPEPRAEQRYDVQFTATAGEYFRIWIVNLALTIVTLGIYSAWATVRKRRYLYANTRIDNEGLDYRASPIPILKGRLIAVAALAVLWFAGSSIPVFAAKPVLAKLALLAVGAIGGPWIVVRSLKFNAWNTAYRNVRLCFDGTYGACLRIVAKHLWVVIMPIAYPYLKRRLVQFAAQNHSFGTTRFTVLDFGKPFLHAYAVAYGFSFVGFLVLLLAGMFPGKAQPFFMLGFYVFMLLITAYLHAQTVNAVWNSIRIGPVRFESRLRPRDVMWLDFSNAVAVVLTIGLATPWAVVRTLRYRAMNTAILASGSLDEFVQAEAEPVGAAGAQIGELFDLDLAL